MSLKEHRIRAPVIKKIKSKSKCKEENIEEIVPIETANSQLFIKNEEIGNRLVHTLYGLLRDRRVDVAENVETHQLNMSSRSSDADIMTKHRYRDEDVETTFNLAYHKDDNTMGEVRVVAECKNYKEGSYMTYSQFKSKILQRFKAFENSRYYKGPYVRVAVLNGVLETEDIKKWARRYSIVLIFNHKQILDIETQRGELEQTAKDLEFINEIDPDFRDERLRYAVK
jgi:hypothetical protein